MYSVEMRVDIGGKDGIPHSFIVVTGPDGVERGYGFAPRESGSLTGDGKIYDDTNHEYSQTTGKIPLDADSYRRLMDYIQKSTESPPPLTIWIPVCELGIQSTYRSRHPSFGFAEHVP